MENEEYTTESVIVEETALSHFGIKYLFPWQRLVISNILEAYEYSKLEQQMSEEEKKAYKNENRDSFCMGRQIVLLPTGAGKSLCFQIPAMLLDGPTLIIYPLLALMTDQQRRMQEAGLECVVFRGGQTEEERNILFEKINNGAKIILANPEVLASDRLLEKLCTYRIKHIAIDEAHTVSEWGNTFRKAYLETGHIIKKLNAPIITAFTATASPEVLENVSQILFEGQAHIVRSESDRPNIHYYVIKAAAKKKKVLELTVDEDKPMIVFCGTRHKAEDMAREINVFFGNQKARFYHAGLEKDEKEDTEKWFYESKDGILCATCAYGMGVDKKDIKTVVHLEASETAEAYIQEAGRGGRNGETAKAILLWSPQDSADFELYGKQSRQYSMKIFAETKNCRRQVLLDALGAEQAYCSGCDNCNPKKNMILSDWETALNLVKKYKNFYTKETLEEELRQLSRWNSIKKFGRDCWTHSDITEITSELLKCLYIKKGKFLWRNMLSINKKSKKKTCKKSLE